jgi:hypothetical protein
MSLRWGFYVSLVAMPFICQGGGESIRDATRTRSAPLARLTQTSTLSVRFVRVRDSDIQTTHIAVAVEGVS